MADIWQCFLKNLLFLADFDTILPVNVYTERLRIIGLEAV